MHHPYGCNGSDVPDFVPATELPSMYLHMVFHAVAHLAVQHDQKLTIVGWHKRLGWLHEGHSGIQLCSDGCREGDAGTYTVITDMEYIEVQANQEAAKYGPTIVHIPLQDGRAAVVIVARHG
jgi:hypothetical protein